MYSAPLFAHYIQNGVQLIPPNGSQSGSQSPTPHAPSGPSEARSGWPLHELSLLSFPPSSHHHHHHPIFLIDLPCSSSPSPSSSSSSSSLTTPVACFCRPFTSGGIGTAIMYYLLSKGVMLSLRFDPFHRAVNDIKGACKHACGGLFRRVMLFTAFIFGINYGPFGKGANFHEKQSILEYFYSNLDSDSPEFRRFAVGYAMDNDMRHHSNDDFDIIFDSLADMPSVNFKGPLTKLMRWFSWWENHKFHRKELRALKGIIAYY
eukprot:7693051-Pyramimonas_sp.AAC.1